MLNCGQLTEFIIKRALYDLQLLSDDAVELMVFTCANESLGGTYLHQIQGPALGIYQMEPKTYNDLWQNYIAKKGSLYLKFIQNFDASYMPNEDRLVYDLRFATAMTRVFYARIPEPLPKYTDTDAIWKYYKTYYNTLAGKADWNNAIGNYHRFKSNIP